MSISSRLFYKNTFFNYVSVIWMGIGILLVIPIYIKLLSANGWGVISSCLAVQGVLLILDAGCSQIMPRDIAKEKDKDSTYAAYFLIFLLISVLGASIVFCSSGWLASYWFNAGGNYSELNIALQFISVQFLFQFLNNVNVGYWNGMQRQIKTNISQVTFFTLKHCVSILVLYHYPKPYIYLLVYSSITIIEFITNFLIIRFNDRVVIKINLSTVKNAVGILCKNYSFSAGVILGVLVSQLDKILLSHTLDTKIYGVYVVVAQLGLAFLQLQYPIIKALLPAISTAGNISIFEIIPFKKICQIMVLLMGPVALTAFYSHEILFLWTKNQFIADHGHLVLSAICLSVMVNIPYTFIYTNLVRNQMGFAIFASNIVSLILMLMYFMLFSVSQGILVGGVMWLIYATTSLLIGGGLLLRRGSTREV